MDNIRVEINLKNLRENYQKIQRWVGLDVKVMPIVKANAYGHGLLRIARELVDAGADWLGVANLDEAALLRKEHSNLAILILTPLASADFSRALSGDFRITLEDQDRLNFLHTQARILGRRARVHIKVNTGMNRFGVELGRAIELVEKAKSFQNILVEAIYSHFYAGADSRANLQQFNQFSEVLFDLQKRDLEIPLRHLANSETIINFDQSFFEIVRPGALVYGLAGIKELDVKPVLSWKAKILKIRRVKKGQCLGYGGNFRAKKDIDAAVLGVGYADGYDRSLSGIAKVLIGGKLCQVISNICMNYTFVDLSPAMRVSKKLSPQVGDEAILIGQVGDQEEITAQDLAGWAKTDVREIVSRIPAGVVREYV